MELKVHYDSDEDVLYIAREGVEDQAVEVHPGINLELDREGEIIGVEILKASRLLREVVEPIRLTAQARE